MKIENIKKIIKEILITVMIVGIVSSLISYVRKPNISDKALSTLVARDIHGKMLDISDYGGKPILVNFWATWCPVCKLELSNIQRVSRKYQVITIAVKSGTDSKIRDFMKDHQSDFRVINDNSGAISSKFDIDVYPTTLIYDAHGKLSSSEVGYTTTGGLLARMLWADK